MGTRKVTALATMGLVALLAATGVQAANYSWDFESYTLGDVVGQDGWTGGWWDGVTSPSVTNSVDYVLSGTKSGTWDNHGDWARHSLVGQTFNNTGTHLSFLFQGYGFLTDFYMGFGTGTGGSQDLSGWYLNLYPAYRTGGGAEILSISTSTGDAYIADYRLADVYQWDVDFDFPNQRVFLTVKDLTINWTYTSQYYSLPGPSQGGATPTKDTAAGWMTVRGYNNGPYPQYGMHGTIDNLTFSNPIPEPSGMLALGSALLGACAAGALRRRR